MQRRAKRQRCTDRAIGQKAPNPAWFTDRLGPGRDDTIVGMLDDLPPATGTADWPEFDPLVLAKARDAVLAAIKDSDRAARRLGSYYDPAGDYAGASFLTIAPNDPGQVTAADLFAMSLLNVKVGPSAARRLLDDEQHRTAICRCLEALSSTADLKEATASTLSQAGALYETVKQALKDPTAARPDPWVTASKLCGRKRPFLVPVRDRKVRELLGIEPPYDYRLDWQLYRELIRDNEIAGLVAAATSAAATHTGAPVGIADPTLRVLDVALWTHAVGLDL